MVKTATEPPIEPGDRIPDVLLQTPAGHEARLHDLCDDRFVALHFADARRRPVIPANDSPALVHYLVSRWDAPLDAGFRDRALLDPGDRLFKRLGILPDTVVLLRPDEHVAGMAPMDDGAAAQLYEQAVGRPAPRA
jgi:3-(3-hydroxy-phenyl)propionate hydroxylase